MNMNNSEIYQIILMFSIFTISLLIQKYKDKKFNEKTVINKIKYPLFISLLSGLTFAFVNDNNNLFKKSKNNYSTQQSQIKFYTEYPNF